jgi:hypothetical protein
MTKAGLRLLLDRLALFWEKCSPTDEEREAIRTLEMGIHKRIKEALEAGRHND